MKNKPLWNIEELESFFNSIELPTEPINLNVCTVIVNCKKFVDSHLRTVKKNANNSTYLPYYERLARLKELLIKNKKNEKY